MTFVSVGLRDGTNPPSDLRRDCRYCISGLSSDGRKNGDLCSCSSLSSMPKRSRNAASSSSFSFFCWWVMFLPSPASPSP